MLGLVQTGALRRLQRETFSDLLKIKERLDKLELHTGLRSSRNYGGSFGVAKTKLTGQVNAGAAMVLMNGSSSRESRSALEQSGMLTGLQAQFKFETSFRDKDKLVTECVAGGGSEAGANGALGGAIALKKVAYRAEVSDRVTVSVAPFGGDSSDILQPVNPVQVCETCSPLSAWRVCPPQIVHTISKLRCLLGTGRWTDLLFKQRASPCEPLQRFGNWSSLQGDEIRLVTVAIRERLGEQFFQLRVT